jgi:hypothetical protein
MARRNRRKPGTNGRSGRQRLELDSIASCSVRAVGYRALSVVVTGVAMPCGVCRLQLRRPLRLFVSALFLPVLPWADGYSLRPLKD